MLPCLKVVGFYLPMKQQPHGTRERVRIEVAAEDKRAWRLLHSISVGLTPNLVQLLTYRISLNGSDVIGHGMVKEVCVANDYSV
jgi:hypothetical protein